MEAGAPEPTVCCVCGSDASQVVTQGPDYEYGTLEGRIFTVVQCTRCGHVYIDPRPAPDELSAIYPPTYYTVNPRSPFYLQGFIYDQKLKRDVKRLLGQMPQRVRAVADLGCGDGQRLARLGEQLPRDCERVGVDLQPDPRRVAELSARGIRLVQANIEEDLGVLPDEGYDAIIMSQVIEHLRWPPHALERVVRKLAPGGRLILETPNVGGFDHRLFRRRYWGAYHLPRHFHLFTQASMTGLLERVALRVVERGYLPSPGFWITSLRNVLGLGAAERSRHPAEFLSYSNLPVVGFFTAVDLACIALGLATSTQYLVGEKPAAP